MVTLSLELIGAYEQWGLFSHVHYFELTSIGIVYHFISQSFSIMTVSYSVVTEVFFLLDS